MAAPGSLTKLLGIGRRADPGFGRRLAGLAALSLAAAVIELAALGSLVPLLALLAEGRAQPPLFSTLVPGEPMGLVIFFTLLVLAAALVRLWLSAAIQRGVLWIGHSVNVAIQDRLLAQPYLFHASSNSSRFVAALHKTDQLASGVLGPLLHGLAGLVIGGAILAFLLVTIDWRVTLGAGLLLGGSYWLLSRLAGRRLVERGGVAEQAHEEQVRLLMESSGAIRDILLDHRQRAFGAAFERSSRRMAEARAGTDFLHQAPRFLVEAIGAIALAALAALVAIREGGLAASLPMFGLLALAMVRIVPLAQTAYRGWAMLSANRRAIDEVAELLELPEGHQADEPGSPLPFEQTIRVDGVGFTYPGAATPVLAGASMTIAAGEWVGMTGPTGGGKSTLGDLVMGLVAPDEGAIVVDGQRLDSSLVPRWQRSVAHVSQSVYLIDASIAANIALTADGADLDLSKIAECTAIAQLDRWIATLPGGIESMVGERGRLLSGGQRQRIAIARALYKTTPFMLFDEATSALDPATEAALLDSIRRERPGVTLLLISHRAAALDRCDRMVRVEGGRLAPA